MTPAEIAERFAVSEKAIEIWPSSDGPVPLRGVEPPSYNTNEVLSWVKFPPWLHKATHTFITPAGAAEKCGLDIVILSQLANSGILSCIVVLTGRYREHRYVLEEIDLLCLVREKLPDPLDLSKPMVLSKMVALLKGNGGEELLEKVFDGSIPISVTTKMDPLVALGQILKFLIRRRYQ